MRVNQALSGGKSCPGFMGRRPSLLPGSRFFLARTWIQRVLEVKGEFTLMPLPDASTTEAKPRVLGGLAKARGG